MIEVPCPSCRRAKVRRGVATFPFCSEACRDRDLSAWTEERYRIAGEPTRGDGEPPDDDEVDPPAPSELESWLRDS